jgi:solute carrier family 25 phosphate transporter 23/24/25/41
MWTQIVVQGINFAAYEWLRLYITPPGKEHYAWQKLSCGALAGK